MSHWRTERASLLLQVGNLDKKVLLWEGAVQRGGKVVVVLLKRKKFQEHELERAAIAAEAARTLTPPRATSPATRHPHGSNVAAVVPTVTSTRQSSPPGPPIAASNPVRQRPTWTIPKHKTRTSNTFQSIQEERPRSRQRCGYSGGRSTTARSVDKRSTTTYSGSQPHQHTMGHIQETSAGPRDRWGNRVELPANHHHRRAGAGQRARPEGWRLTVHSRLPPPEHGGGGR